MPNSIPISRLYILTVCIRVFNSFLFFGKSLMSPMYIKRLIYSCYLLSLYPAEHFLKMWLSHIMAITNINGDTASPWNTFLWIFTSVNLFLPAINSTFQVCMVFSINCTTWSGILYIFGLCSFLGTFLWGSFWIIHPGICFLHAFILFGCKSVLYGGEILNENPWMPSRSGVFQFAIFLSVVLSLSGCMLTWGPSSSIFNFVPMLFIHSAFFFIIILFVYFALSRSVVDMASPILPLISALEHPILSVLFGLVLVSF